MAEITVQSMVSHRTREPMVSIYWPTNQDAAQLTPDEARRFALSIIEAAEAAEQDAFLIAWGTTKIGLDDSRAGQILNDYRNWRVERRGETPETGGGRESAPGRTGGARVSYATANCVCGATVDLAVEETYTYRACVRCRIVVGDARACVMCNGETVEMSGAHLTGACRVCSLAYDLIVPPPVWMA